MPKKPQKVVDAPDRPQIKAVATNRRARFEYAIEESFEAGISLTGSEVKSLRSGKASLQDAYGLIRAGEAFLVGAHIPPYAQASMMNHEPLRIRKLLLHSAEIKRLASRTVERGVTMVPLRLYFKGNKVKVEIALARGKQLHDKRQSIAKREAEREIAKRVGRRG